MKIEAIHDFHDEEYAREWAERFDPSGERLQLIEDIGDEIEKLNIPNARVLELGIGPGFLAKYLLDRFPEIRYYGLDFSKPMLNIATQRVIAHFNRFAPVECNLIEDDFHQMVNEPVDVIVSTWALHDLFAGENIWNVYQKCQTILNGVLLNGDFIKPEGIDTDYEGGRIEIRKHLEFLKDLGYKNVRSSKIYEENREDPSTSNNYALIIAEF